MALGGFDQYIDKGLSRELLGPELFDEYVDTFKRFHYASPDFDCEGAGFGNKTAAAAWATAKRRLDQLNRSNNDCQTR